MEVDDIISYQSVTTAQRFRARGGSRNGFLELLWIAICRQSNLLSVGE